jgi:hypothetical protein
MNGRKLILFLLSYQSLLRFHEIATPLLHTNEYLYGLTASASGAPSIAGATNA